MGGVVAWNTVRDGELTFAVVRSMHVPHMKYRISSQTFARRTELAGISIAGRLYVLRGSLSYRIGDSEWRLQAPSYLDHPEGEFALRAHEEVEIVQVWEIPSVS